MTSDRRKCFRLFFLPFHGTAQMVFASLPSAPLVGDIIFSFWLISFVNIKASCSPGRQRCVRIKLNKLRQFVGGWIRISSTNNRQLALIDFFSSSAPQDHQRRKLSGSRTGRNCQQKPTTSRIHLGQPIS